MMLKMRTVARAATAAFVGLVACSSDEAIEPQVVVDAGVDGGVQVFDAGQQDTGVGPQRPPGTVRISGQTLRLDSFLAGTDVPVNGTTVRAIGTVGVPPAASNANGDYQLDVPQDGQLILGASAQGQYLESYEAITVGGVDINDRDFYIAYRPHVDRLGQSFGVEFNQPFPCHAPNQGQCVYALIIGRVVDDGSAAGGRPTPLEGVGPNDFVLKGEGDANWYKKGPYFFFFNGQPDPQATATTRRQSPMTGLYEGGLFAFYVEIPQIGPGAQTFEVAAASRAGGVQQRYFGPKTFTAYRGGFTWVELAETGLPIDPNPMPPPIENVDFATQVYPLFLPVNQGGFGCQGCHTNQNNEAPAGGLNLYGDIGQVYQQLNPAQYPQRVNVQNPGLSALLTKPLYEPVGDQNHPIFAFFSEQDPAYRTIYGWISEGAVYNGNVPPPNPVSFYNEVRPILYGDVASGGAGCVSCHVTGVNAGNAPGGAYFGGDGDALHQVLTQQPATDNSGTGEPYRINRNGQPAQSLVLTNPLVGSPELHPAKLFNGVNDPRYQTIYRWIQEGYVNDTP